MSIFFMVCPYVMIHFPKPYLEACGALVAGVVLVNYDDIFKR